MAAPTKKKRGNKEELAAPKLGPEKERRPRRERAKLPPKLSMKLALQTGLRRHRNRNRRTKAKRCSNCLRKDHKTAACPFTLQKEQEKTRPNIPRPEVQILPYSTSELEARWAALTDVIPTAAKWVEDHFFRKQIQRLPVVKMMSLKPKPRDPGQPAIVFSPDSARRSVLRVAEREGFGVQSG
eukprot:RCo027559